MNQSLEPDYAELSDIPVWFQQSRELIRRRWLLFALLTVCYIVLSYFTASMGILTMTLGLVITQFFLLLFLVAAKAADTSREMPVFNLLTIGKRLIAVNLVLAIVATAIILVALFVGSFLTQHMPETQTAGPAIDRIIDKIAPGVMRFFFLYCVITMTAMWFLFPLLLFHQLPLWDSVKLAAWGWKRNEIVILSVSYVPMLIFVVLLLVSEVAMLFCVLAFPFFAVMIYVSYRQIFRRQKDNSPAKQLTSVVQAEA